MDSQLFILNLNCRSIYSKLSELKILIYCQKPHIVCLTETWAVQDRLPTFVNYRAFWQNRTGNRGGGLAILARSDVVTLENSLNYLQNSALEAQMITIIMSNFKIDLLNIYNPERDSSREKFLHYFRQLGNKFIIVGDFNAHHHIWSKHGTQNNAAGSALASILLENTNFCLATPPELTTYVDSRTGKEATLDLCFLSSNLINSTMIDTLGCVGSDHLPVRIKLPFLPVIQKMKNRRRWKLGDVDWHLW